MRRCPRKNGEGWPIKEASILRVRAWALRKNNFFEALKNVHDTAVVTRYTMCPKSTGHELNVYSLLIFRYLTLKTQFKIVTESLVRFIQMFTLFYL